MGYWQLAVGTSRNKNMKNDESDVLYALCMSCDLLYFNKFEVNYCTVIVLYVYLPLVVNKGIFFYLFEVDNMDIKEIDL